jgi:hypothetical protein
MVRRILRLSVLLALTACATTQSSTQATLVQSQSAADYYPLKNGWGWAYNVEQGGENVLAVYAVVGNDGHTATILNAGKHLTYALTYEGIARSESGTTGDYLLKNPIVPKTTWTVLGGEASIVSVGETLTLPSGTYPRCIVVEERRHLPERITRTTYAQGVGPIEMEMRVQNPITQSFETQVRARLLSVTQPESLQPDQKN